MSPKQQSDHSHISEEQKSVLTFLQRQGGDNVPFTPDMKEIQKLERAKAVVVSQTDMKTLKYVQANALRKIQ